MTKVKIVTATEKRAQLRALGITGGNPRQPGAARIIVVVAAVNGSIEINPVVVLGRIQSAPTTINIDLTARIESGPGMRVLAHHSDCQLIGDAVIDPKTHSAGGEVVPVRVSIGVHTDKVTESSHPHTPAVFTARLKDWFHYIFGGLSVGV